MSDRANLNVGLLLSDIFMQKWKEIRGLGLFNQIFFDKKDYRKMQLFSILQDRYPAGIEKKELYIKYQASRKTLFSDIRELEQDFIQIYDKPILKIKENGTFFLEYELEFSFQKLLLFYAGNSRNFWIFNKIVNSQSTSFKELTKTVFFSQSAIYGSMHQLTHYFHPLSISWSFSGIQGNERKIRHLLFESYWSLFGGVSWPFDIIRDNLLVEVEQFEKKVWIFNELERERMLYWLAIMKLRISQGHTLATSKQVSKKNVEAAIHVKFLIEKHVFEKLLITELEEEIDFLMNSLTYFIGCSLTNMEDSEYSPSWEGLKIEEQCIEKGVGAGWDSNQLQQFYIHLKKIRYFWEENLIGWYHFIEPNAAIYFNESKSFLENGIKKLLNEVPLLLASAYMYECKKIGLFFVAPIRIQIISKEGNTIEVEKKIQRFSEYPIEFDQREGARVDIVLTNYLAKQERKEVNENHYFFYDNPLNENKISMILERAIALKGNRKVNYTH